ncbi:DUF6249 domain-containing protein [Luminiphilus sp.]|jgi:hypothetical protein|nr:hypothetical protein [Halieaceae bacterium]MDA8555695.1 DUF6249 domain-containing protein [Luminiphilus sp.]MDB2365868.1 DUF6249 domain-containing protein [Luminiphilus sp.]MDB2689556.1 DUF6249 domain-containing protein [Luminiphilus sp.]MDC0572193.1 DUF6249 domain-containing protein [Luminiphilus sp.]
MLGELVPILGVLTGIIVPVSVFVWLYHDEKNKREAVVEIAKHLEDPLKVEELLTLFDERKKEPIDYRRGGVITLFVGVGIFLLGLVFLGSLFRGIGLLVGAIGVGVTIAGYLYPNTSEELTDAVERFEEK